MTLLTTTDELQELCVALADEAYVALDTEFMRDRTYYPKLCLRIGFEPDRRCHEPTPWPILRRTTPRRIICILVTSAGRSCLDSVPFQFWR